MKLNPTKCTFGVSSGQFLGHVDSKLGIVPHQPQIKNIIKEQEPKKIKDVQSLIGKVILIPPNVIVP